MTKSHDLKQQRGFTIVELLIVIVVIGILAALVLNSFSGVQAKARDTERTTDVKALSTQLEAYYNGDGQGFYPSTGTFSGAGWPISNLKGIDPNTLNAPNQTAGVTMATIASSNDTGTGLAPTTGKDKYIYEPRTGATLCTTGVSCDNFKIWYVTEVDSVTKVKKSLNQ